MSAGLLTFACSDYGDINVGRTTPLYLAKIGMLVTTKFFITDERIKHWKYASECASVGGGLVAGTAQLRIIEKSPLDNRTDVWAVLVMEGSYPPSTLKVSGEEYVRNFMDMNGQ